MKISFFSQIAVLLSLTAVEAELRGMTMNEQESTHRRTMGVVIMGPKMKPMQMMMNSDSGDSDSSSEEGCENLATAFLWRGDPDYTCDFLKSQEKQYIKNKCRAKDDGDILREKCPGICCKSCGGKGKQKCDDDDVP